jgi:hypothetical protein
LLHTYARWLLTHHAFLAPSPHAPRSKINNNFLEGGHVAANGTVENLPSWLAANRPTMGFPNGTLCVPAFRCT